MKLQVFTKNRKHYPSVATRYTVEIVKNKSIIIFKEGVEVNRFNLGDLAEYDRYNLIYTGNITKITEKTVQIEETHNMYGEDHGRRHNLNMYQFCYKNEKFDLEKVRTHNVEESYYI